MERKDRQTLLLGACTLDPSGPTLRSASGSVLHLRSQSMQVLAELAHARGQVVSRDALIESVWPGLNVTDDSLVQCIKDIRSALSDPDRRIVRTVVGTGYSLAARPVGDGRSELPRIFIERFTAAAGNPDAEELGEALFEELVMRLTPRAGVVVLTDPSHRQDASYTISGRARAGKDRARIFVQIARSGGEDVYAGAKDAAGGEIRDLPGRVADGIAALLRVHMIVGDGSELVARDDAELSVQQLMAKAAWHMARFRRGNWHAARAALTAAVGLAPDNPVALAMLASMDTQMIPLIPFSELAESSDEAMRLSERAVELGQSIDYVLRTRGNLKLWRLGDHAGARLDCTRALERDPVFHLAHLTIATSEILCGEFSAGARRLREMMRRAPNDPQIPLYFSLIALGELLDGNAEPAIEAAREGVERNPFGSWNALVYAAAVADAPEITGSETFQRLVGRADLPARHFLDLPFVDRVHAERLAARAITAGIRDRPGNPGRTDDPWEPR